MKSKLFIFPIFLFSLSLSLSSEKVVIDKIIARVNGANILKSDLEKPRIGNNAKPYSLDQLIMEEILFQKAADPQKNLLPKPPEIERQIVAMKIQNGLQEMKDEEFEAQLKSEGFTVQEYKNQMGRILASEKVKHLEVNEKIVVTSQSVEDFCKKNPEHTKESCWIKIALIENDKIKKNKKIKKSELKWDDLGWIGKDDVAKDLAFVFDMKKGSISKPIKKDGQFQVIMVVDKKIRRLKTLEERYIEIERRLQNEKRAKLEREFEKSMKKDATIVYL